MAKLQTKAEERGRMALRRARHESKAKELSARLDHAKRAKLRASRQRAKKAGYSSSRETQRTRSPGDSQRPTLPFRSQSHSPAPLDVVAQAQCELMGEVLRMSRHAAQSQVVKQQRAGVATAGTEAAAVNDRAEALRTGLKAGAATRRNPAASKHSRSAAVARIPVSLIRGPLSTMKGTRVTQQTMKVSQKGPSRSQRAGISSPKMPLIQSVPGAVKDMSAPRQAAILNMTLASAEPLKVGQPEASLAESISKQEQPTATQLGKAGESSASSASQTAQLEQHANSSDEAQDILPCRSQGELPWPMLTADCVGPSAELHIAPAASQEGVRAFNCFANINAHPFCDSSLRRI